MQQQQVELTARELWGLAFRIVGLALASAVGLWLIVTLRDVLVLVLLAIILSNGIAPLVRRLERLGLRPVVSVLLIYLLLLLGLAIAALVIVPPLLEQIESVVRNAPSYGDAALALLHDLQQRFPFLPPLDEQVQAQVRGLGSQIGALATQALVVAQFALRFLGSLLSVVLVLLLTLYLTVDGSKIREYFLSFLPADQRPRVRLATSRMGERMGGWLIGQFALSASVGVATFIGLTILGVRNALLLAVIAAITEVIPIIGPILGAVPAVLVALTQSPLLAALTVALYLVIQQLENNLLVPNIMERAVKLHPLAVVLSLLVGGELLGIVGALLAVPAAAAIAVALEELRRDTPPLPQPPPGEREGGEAGAAPPSLQGRAQGSSGALRGG